MPSRKPKMVNRNRSTLELSILHVEITKESHDFLRELAAAKQMPVGGYVDVWIKRKKKRLSDLGFIQSEDSSLIS